MSRPDLQNSILKLQARLNEIDIVLNRPPDQRLVPNVFGGMSLSRPTKGSRLRLQEDRLHLQQRIRELGTELLLQQYHAARDPSARTAISQKLTERGTPLRTPPDPKALSPSSDDRRPIEKVTPPTTLDSFKHLFLNDACDARMEHMFSAKQKIKTFLTSGETDPKASFTTKQGLFRSGLDAWQESLVALTEKYAQTLKDIIGCHPELVGADIDPPRWVRSQLEQLLGKELGYEISGVMSHGWQLKIVSPTFVWFCQDVCGDPDFDAFPDSGRPEHWCAPAWCRGSLRLWVREGNPELLDVEQTEKLVRISQTRFALRLNYVLDKIEHKTRVGLAASPVTSPASADLLPASPAVDDRRLIVLPISPVKRRRSPLQCDIDPRKKKIAELKSTFKREKARGICTKMDDAMEVLTPAVASQLEPLPAWVQKTHDRTWGGNYNHPQTHKLVRSYINKVPPLF